MTCLRKEDSKISFLLIYAIGFYLEPKKQDIWKIFLFPIYPYFYCVVFLTSFFFSRSSYNVLLYSLGETLYFSLNTRLKVLWLSKPLSSQIVGSFQPLFCIAKPCVVKVLIEIPMEGFGKYPG